MTVSSLSITAGPYTGNDISDTFSFDFTIQDESEIVVFETDLDGVVTELTLDTDYTVSIDDKNVTRTDGPLPSGYGWFMRSDYEPTQETDFESQGGFYPDVHEAAFDKLTYLIQQINNILSRSPLLSESYTGDLPILIDDPVAGNTIRWNDDLKTLENYDADETYVNASGDTMTGPLGVEDATENGHATTLQQLNDSIALCVKLAGDTMTGPLGVEDATENGHATTLRQLNDSLLLVIQSSSNYAGVWSDLTGSLEKGVFVAHNSKYFWSLVDIADVTVSEPGVSSDWQSFIDTGTDFDQIPLNSDLGTSSTVDTGTDFDQVPLNSNIVYPVANVAALRALTGISVGQEISTSGYYLENDGGGSTYIVSSSETVDEYGDHTLADGKVAKLKRDNLTVSVLKYGIEENNTVDRDANFQAIIDANDKIDLHSTVNIFGTITLKSGLKFYNGGIRQADTFTGTEKSYMYAGSGPYINKPGLFGDSLSDIKFTDVDLDGNTSGRVAASGYSSSIVLLKDCTDCKWRDCDTHDNHGDNPTLEGGAILLQGGSDHDYINGKIRDITGEGWHTRANYTSVKCTVLKNSTSSLVGSQLINGETENFGKGLIVADCKEVSGTLNGAAISCNHTNSSVIGNIVHTVAIGIILGHRSSFERRSPATGSSATGNIISNTVSSAIQLQYGTKLIVAGGSITDFGTNGDVVNSYGILGTSWSGGGSISNVVISNGPGGVKLSADTSDIDETVIPNWSVSGCDIDEIEGYGIRSDSCSGKVHIKGNTLKNVNKSAVSTRSGIAVFHNYSGMESTNGDCVISGNSIGSRTTNCFRCVSISITDAPDAVIRHKVTNNDAINASTGFVFSPPSLVLQADNYLDAIIVT